MPPASNKDQASLCNPGDIQAIFEAQHSPFLFAEHAFEMPTTGSNRDKATFMLLLACTLDVLRVASMLTATAMQLQNCPEPMNRRVTMHPVTRSCFSELLHPTSAPSGRHL